MTCGVVFGGVFELKQLGDRAISYGSTPFQNNERCAHVELADMSTWIEEREHHTHRLTRDNLLVVGIAMDRVPCRSAVIELRAVAGADSLSLTTKLLGQVCKQGLNIVWKYATHAI
jgi:hypothetical protein